VSFVAIFYSKPEEANDRELTHMRDGVMWGKWVILKCRQMRLSMKWNMC